MAGSQMLDRYGEHVKVFIHDVVGQNAIKDDTINYFTSYVELAELFQQLNIFEDEDVAIISQSALFVCRAVSNATQEQKLIHCRSQPEITAGSKPRANSTQSNRNKVGRRTQSKARDDKPKNSTKQAKKRTQTGRNSRK